jgi:predicted RNase H-like nuclease (RuvC/YqgF family)
MKNHILRPLEQTKHLEGTKEQLPAEQNEEDLETPHKQKAGKSHKRIRKLKKENKMLKRKVKKVEALKLKVGKLREIIKELRKQLEQADKAHQIKKTKGPKCMEETLFVKEQSLQTLWEHKQTLNR